MKVQLLDFVSSEKIVPPNDHDGSFNMRGWITEDGERFFCEGLPRFHPKTGKYLLASTKSLEHLKSGK
jgi:hypothetical protein